MKLSFNMQPDFTTKYDSHEAALSALTRGYHWVWASGNHLISTRDDRIRVFQLEKHSPKLISQKTDKDGKVVRKYSKGYWLAKPFTFNAKALAAIGMHITQNQRKKCYWFEINKMPNIRG